MTTDLRNLVPLPEEVPVVDVPTAGGWVNLGRNGSYAAAKRGEIPTIRYGRKLVVSVAEFRRVLGIDK